MEKNNETLSVLRHSCSHIMAQAVQKLFPQAKLAIGPATDAGFYYDFEAEPFSREDLDNLEKEMKKIIKENMISHLKGWSIFICFLIVAFCKKVYK